MTIELITGSPGAGKTTYAVAERVAPEARRELVLDVMGQERRVTRRVLVAGIGGLLVEHEKLPHTLTGDHQSQKVIDFYNALDSDGEHVHKRGRDDDPVDLPATVMIDGKPLSAGPSLFNWWLWCRPGDLIVVDEVQFIVPRGTLGKKPPPYIALLEIHRHYGVDFLFITQHPQLLDTTIRNLVGMHRHVRSVMGSPVCLVYAWDHASNTDRLNLATKSQFVRRANHYRLFKSAVAHVKPPSTGRAVLVVVPLLLLLGWYMQHRIFAQAAPALPGSTQTKPTGQVAPSPGQGNAGVGGSLASTVASKPKAAQSTERTWPVYTAEQFKVGREPLDGRAVQWEGGYTEGKREVAYFGLFVDGERVATVTLSQLGAMGYAWTALGPCVGSLRFGQVERLVTCGKRVYKQDPAPGALPQAPAEPQAVAQAAS